MRRLAWVVTMWALCLGATAVHAQTAAIDPVAALNEGNRLFREGDVDAAIEAYRAGYDPQAVHPTLAFNLGASLHQLDRLPEAVLWYRRAGGQADPWLEDNLWLARRTMGSQSLPADGLDRLIVRHGDAVRWLAIGLAWLLAAASFARGHGFGRTQIVLALTALILFAGAWAADRWAAQPAVLQQDCSTSAGQLPAGTEAWVRRRGDGRWQIAAHSEEAICPAEAVALVTPPVGQ